MDEKGQEEFIYHNGVAYASDEDERQQRRSDRAQRRGDLRFTAIQAAVCALFVLAALLLRGLSPDLTEKVGQWYHQHMEDSVLIDYDPDNVKREFLSFFERKEESTPVGTRTVQSGKEE